jgi:MraZ protein
MFRGGFAHNLDDKGRVIIPQKFRLLLGEKFVITKGLDRCLWVFTDEDYRALDSRLSASSMLDANAVRLQRFFSAEAADSLTDSQGRVAIPASLREYASIEKEVMIVGAGNRLEIWSRARWDEMQDTLNDDLIRSAAKEIGLSGVGADA